MPHVAGLLCAVNIAFDPYQRLSAHGLFSRVPASEFPFQFQQPFYLIVSLRGLPDGERMLTMHPETGGLEFDRETNNGPITVKKNLVVIALSVSQCVVHRAGPQYVAFTIDGEPLEPVFAFQVD
jgi:hypothetical protein